MATINKNNLYPATFTEATVCNAGATVSLVAGVYTKIGEYTVKADELVGLGRGSYSALNEAIGRLYASFKDSSNNAITQGKFRVMLVTSQDIPVGAKPVCIDVDLAQLTAGASAPSERFVLPFDGTLLSKDKKIQFYILNTTGSAITLTAANCSVLMDVTRCLI